MMSPLLKGMEARLGDNVVPTLGSFSKQSFPGGVAKKPPLDPPLHLQEYHLLHWDTQTKSINFAVSKDGKHFSEQLVTRDSLQMKIDMLILILGTFPKKENKSAMLKRPTTKRVVVILLFL